MWPPPEYPSSPSCSEIGLDRRTQAWNNNAWGSLCGKWWRQWLLHIRRIPGSFVVRDSLDQSGICGKLKKKIEIVSTAGSELQMEVMSLTLCDGEGDKSFAALGVV